MDYNRVDTDNTAAEVYDSALYDSYLSPLEAFYQREQKQANEVAFVQPYPTGRVEEITWAQVGEQVRTMAAYLGTLELEQGSRVAILSNNCAHWIMADLAIWMAGFVGVPLYPVLTAASIQPILEHSECQAIFIGKLADWPAMEAGVPETLHRISLPICPAEVKNAKPWLEVMTEMSALAHSPVMPMEALATIIYTSGTTGMPKGVMHSFRNLAAVGELTGRMYESGSQDRMLSYLPLAHCAERAAVQTNQLYRGFRVYFANSLETFGEDLQRARPTLFFAVPRIWLKLQQRVLEKIPAKKLDFLLRLPLISHFIRKKLTGALGMDQLNIAISGAAPLSTHLIDWYGRLGVTILEGYAMSENFAYSHASKQGEGRIGYVGSTNPHVVCKIADSGEILVKSPTNMTGYYKEPELSVEAIDPDGFLHTGDKGEIDSEGRLKITGRIKDIFKTSKGKYVAPAPIEDKFMKSVAIEQVCVAGSDLPQPLALVTLTESAQKARLVESSKEELSKEMDRLLNDVNALLDKHERMTALVILTDTWSVENNMMTPTLKIKRAEVESAYQASFGQWSLAGGVVWA